MLSFINMARKQKNKEKDYILDLDMSKVDMNVNTDKKTEARQRLIRISENEEYAALWHKGKVSQEVLDEITAIKKILLNNENE